MSKTAQNVYWHVIKLKLLKTKNGKHVSVIQQGKLPTGKMWMKNIRRKCLMIIQYFYHCFKKEKDKGLNLSNIFLCVWLVSKWICCQNSFVKTLICKKVSYWTIKIENWQFLTKLIIWEEFCLSFTANLSLLLIHTKKISEWLTVSYKM